MGTSFLKRRILHEWDKKSNEEGLKEQDEEETGVRILQGAFYFLAMLSIFCFFFRRGRVEEEEEEDTPTSEEVDWETCQNMGVKVCSDADVYLFKNMHLCLRF